MKSLTILALSLAVALSFSTSTKAQGDSQLVDISNSDVLTMVKAKLSPELIVAKIKSSRCHFATFRAYLLNSNARAFQIRSCLRWLRLRPARRQSSSGSPKPTHQPRPKPNLARKPKRATASVAPDNYEPPTEHYARPGDLLFSRANTTELVGAVAYVQSTPPNVLLPDKLWRFVWRQPAKAEPLFVWALFQTPTLRREIGRRATGTSGSMKNISQEKVFGISTILPPISLQREFARRTEAVEKLKTAQRASLAEMDALFATLKHRAFNGELSSEKRANL